MEGLFAICTTMLRPLYFRGPSLFGFGFWQGQAPADMCASITTVPASHWQSHPSECEAVLRRNLDAFAIGVIFFAAITLAWKLLHMMLMYMFFTRPLIRQMGTVLLDFVTPDRVKRILRSSSRSEGPHPRDRQVEGVAVSAVPKDELNTLQILKEVEQQNFSSPTASATSIPHERGDH
jgi:hypothetical protein